MKQINALPSWADDGAANVRSAKFQELSFSLDVTLGALAGATPGPRAFGLGLRQPRPRDLEPIRKSSSSLHEAKTS